MRGGPKHREQGSFQSHWRQNYPRRYHRHHLALATERARCYDLYSKSYSSQSSSAGLRRCFFASSQVVFSAIRDGPKMPGSGTQGPKRRGKGEPGMCRYWYSSQLLLTSCKVANYLVITVVMRNETQIQVIGIYRIASHGGIAAQVAGRRFSLVVCCFVAFYFFSVVPKMLAAS